MEESHEWDNNLKNIINLLCVLEKINTKFFEKIYYISSSNNTIDYKQKISQKIFDIYNKLVKDTIYFKYKIFSFKYNETTINELKIFKSQFLEYINRTLDFVVNYNIDELIYPESNCNIIKSMLKNMIKNLKIFKATHYLMLHNTVLYIINIQTSEDIKKKLLEKILIIYNIEIKIACNLIVKIKHYENIDNFRHQFIPINSINKLDKDVKECINRIDNLNNIYNKYFKICV